MCLICECFIMHSAQWQVVVSSGKGTGHGSRCQIWKLQLQNFVIAKLKFAVSQICSNKSAAATLFLHLHKWQFRATKPTSQWQNCLLLLQLKKIPKTCSSKGSLCNKSFKYALLQLKILVAEKKHLVGASSLQCLFCHHKTFFIFVAKKKVTKKCMQAAANTDLQFKMWHSQLLFLKCGNYC